MEFYQIHGLLLGDLYYLEVPHISSNMMHEYTKQEQITILQGEIEVFKKRIDPNKSKVDILYLADTISMLESRIKELEDD